MFYKAVYMARSDSSPNFADCLTVGEAAEFLGVSTATLRNWDRNGKLKPRRHPQNGYRIYLHEDLEAVLRSADLSTLTDAAFAPQVDWSEMRDSEHFVQFYENDDFLIESVSGFVGAALAEGQASIVIATQRASPCAAKKADRVRHQRRRRHRNRSIHRARRGGYAVEVHGRRLAGRCGALRRSSAR